MPVVLLKSELVAVLVGVAAVDDVGTVASGGVLDQVEEESSAHGIVVVGEPERAVEEGAGTGLRAADGGAHAASEGMPRAGDQLFVAFHDDGGTRIGDRSVERIVEDGGLQETVENGVVLAEILAADPVVAEAEAAEVFQVAVRGGDRRSPVFHVVEDDDLRAGLRELDDRIHVNGVSVRREAEDVEALRGLLGHGDSMTKKTKRANKRVNTNNVTTECMTINRKR